MFDQKKKKVLIVQGYNPLETRGISVVTFGMAKQMARLGCSVSCASHNLSDSFAGKTVDGVLTLKLKTIDDLYSAIEASDIVVPIVSFSSVFKPSGITVGIVCEKLKKPYVPWVHTTLQNSKFNAVYGVNDYVQDTSRFLISEMLKSAACARIVAVSQAVEDSIVSLSVDPSMVCVIYNGIEVEKILGKVNPLPPKSNDVICVQRLSAEKGNTLTCTVLANLKKLIPDFKCVLVGEGNEVGLVKTLLRVFELEDNVRLISYLENGELTKEIACSRAFLSTSLTESFGLSIAESMLVGTPVVVPNIEGPKELTEQGNCGFVFELGDTVTPAMLLINIISEKNKTDVAKITKLAQQKAKSDFDLKTQGELFHKVVMKAINDAT